MAVEKSAPETKVSAKTRSQSQAAKKAKKCEEEKAILAEAERIARIPRSSVVKLLDKPTWGKGYERVIGDDGKAIDIAPETAKRAKGTKKQKTGNLKQAAVTSPASDERAKGAQSVPKQQTSVTKPRPALPRAALTHPDLDDQPLAAKPIIVRAPRIKLKVPSQATSNTVRATSNIPPPTTDLTGHGAENVSVVPDGTDRTQRTEASKTSRKEPTSTASESGSESSSEASSEEEEDPLISSGPSESEYDGNASDQETDDDQDEISQRGESEELTAEVQTLEIDIGESSLPASPLSTPNHSHETVPPAGVSQHERASKKSSTDKHGKKRPQPGSPRNAANSELDDAPPAKRRSKADRAADVIDRPVFKTEDAGLLATRGAAIPSTRQNPSRGEDPAIALHTKRGKLTKEERTKLLVAQFHAHEELNDAYTRLRMSDDGKINLLMQQEHIMALLHDAFREASGYIAFERAADETDPRFEAFRQIVIDLASTRGPTFAAIVDRLKTDYHYAKAFTDQMNQRCQIMRTKMKTYTDNNVEGEYGLKVGECREVIDALIDRQGYVYPGDILGSIDGSQPFMRNIIIKLLKVFFFQGTGRTPSIAATFPNRFRSSVLYQENELEIPVPMLALCCAMIKLSLDTWEANQSADIAAPFSMTECVKEYDAVVEYLKSIQKTGPNSYHRFLHNVYLAVCGASQSASVAHDGRPPAVSRIVFDETR